MDLLNLGMFVNYNLIKLAFGSKVVYLWPTLYTTLLPFFVVVSGGLFCFGVPNSAGP